MSDKPTKGPWRPHRLASYTEPGWVILWPDKDGTHLRRIDFKGNFIEEDARLIAEAGTVYHETGKTPREMEQQCKQLEEALLLALPELNGLALVSPYAKSLADKARAALSAAERKTT